MIVSRQPLGLIMWVKVVLEEEFGVGKKYLGDGGHQMASMGGDKTIMVYQIGFESKHYSWG